MCQSIGVPGISGGVPQGRHLHVALSQLVTSTPHVLYSNGKVTFYMRQQTRTLYGPVKLVY